MELARFCDCMESIAPRGLALDFDNVGLQVEPDHKEIKRSCWPSTAPPTPPGRPSTWAWTSW